MKTFQDILKKKRDYYGNTEAAIEFAANDWLRQCIPTDEEITRDAKKQLGNYSYGIFEQGAHYVTDKLNKALK
jgi:hypothetical protein